MIKNKSQIKELQYAEQDIQTSERSSQTRKRC